MRSLACCLGVMILAGISLIPSSSSDKQTSPKDTKRIPWTTSRIQGSPEPPLPYISEVAFPKLKFSEPLDIATTPEGKQMFVAERRGKIFTFLNDRQTKQSHLVIDLKTQLRGLTVHPKFKTNGYVYVTYIVDEKQPRPWVLRVSQFQAKGNPPRIDRKSERKIIEWRAEGHTGGGLQFGPDGYLYVGTGDGSGIADALHTGQDVSDLLASMLRIDINPPTAKKGYRIPKDNPFVNRKGIRPEIWAYGLRQPWRFSFDKQSGDLWVGDVGQDLWEMVHRIEKGGNYGWSVKEGTHPFRPKRKLGPTPILPPIVEHSHTDFRSVTGGYVYHGKRLPKLQGAYIYGDFDTGRIWGLRVDGKKVKWNKELDNTSLRIIAFTQDNTGEIYYLDFMGGQIYRLTERPRQVTKSRFPRKLSETGLFTSTKDMKPAPGLIPYSVNSPLWGDHTTKERFLALPGHSQIKLDSVTYPQPSPGAPPGWGFPNGTVLVKTFFLEMERGNPKSKRRLETRILHFEQLAGTSEIGAENWAGYTYVWNEDQTDAELLGADGLDKILTIRDGKTGTNIRQKYHFPSRAECTLCHTMAAKFALGVNTLQMNRDFKYADRTMNQLQRLESMGVFTKPLPKPPEKLPKLIDYRDRKQPLATRAKAYLHSNCGHCHIKWGGGNADFKLLATLPVDKMGIINTQPGQGTFNIPGAKILVPGDPHRSLIYHRMKLTGLGRMPHIATSVVDEEATQLIHDWIKEMR